MLIVSAVKICKQCLETASTVPKLLTGACSWTLLVDPRLLGL